MRSLFFILLISNYSTAHSQLTVKAGLTHSFTDVQGDRRIGKKFPPNLTTKNTGIYLAASFPVRSFDLEIGLLNAKASDKDIRQPDENAWWRWIRGYEFSTWILEAAATKKIGGNIYLRTGPGLAWVINPDKEERKFGSLQPFIPVIIGITRGFVSLEVNYRKYFTDMIDGYSKRADPNDNDAVVTTSLTYTFHRSKYRFLKCIRP